MFIGAGSIFTSFSFSIVLLFLLVTAALAADSSIKFKDMPDNHWAAPAVYDLVKLGVTKGYPDGTFRGDKQISRYETALFLSKLAKSLTGNSTLKKDIDLFRQEIVAWQQKPQKGMLDGSYQAAWKFCNLLANTDARGALANYRLQLGSTYKLGDSADIRVGLDTTDYGYFNDGLSTTGIVATDLLDITSNLKLSASSIGWPDPVELKLSVGPGPKQHTADPTGIISSEVGVTYLRPYTGITVATSFWGTKVAAGYEARGHAASGRITANNIFGTLGYEFKGIPLIDQLQLTATGQQLSTGQYSIANRDLRASIVMNFPLGNKIEAGGTLGLSGQDRSKWLVGGSVAINDVWDTGTVAVIKAAKVGAGFIDDRFAAAEIDLAGFDNFNRPLVNGSVNIGGQIVQSVSDDLKLVGKGDVRLQPDYTYAGIKGRLTAEGGISYAVAPNTTFDARYRFSHDKSTNTKSDLAALGLVYQF